MCGICGIVTREGLDIDDLQRMQDSIRHRGPDDEGIYQDNNIMMGSRRLSIIDLAVCAMPISNEDKSVWIVYNGEIYNHKTLRQELLDKGHRFKTKTDTEVIVHLYEEYGIKCLDKLDGMFAFAIWDKRNQQLFLARDRIGQKPLFYTNVNQTFLFASEIKAILAVNKFTPTLDLESVHHYLSLRFIQPPHTMFKEIRKLPAGHFMIVRNSQITISRYWDICFRDKKHLSETDFIDGLNDNIQRAVTSHMVSDVPVGAFLSGGLDSSTIVSTMSLSYREKFKTFSIGVAENDFNEIPYARMVAQQYQTDQIEKVIDINIIHSLPRMIWHLDEPSDPIAPCFDEAAKLAAQHVKVVLGGDGGDELFAGFDRYHGLEKSKLLDLMPRFGKRLLDLVASNVSENFSYKSYTQKLRWLNRVLTFQDMAERYAEANFFFRFNHTDKKALYTDSLWGQFVDNNSSDLFKYTFNQPNAETLLDKMIYTDLMTRLPEHTLMMTDRLNMAQSLEARSPFLDHHLIEFMATLPCDLKIRKGNLKYILKETMKSKLPTTIINRKKQGFMIPLAYWFRSALYPSIKNLLLDSFFVREGFFRKSTIMQLIEEHISKKVDHHVRIWMLLNLEIWHQLYIENITLESIEENLRR